MRSRRSWIALTLAFGLVFPLLIQADSVSTTERTVTKLTDNVYVIRHKDAPDGFPQSNTTVVIGDSAVLVVDSTYLPSSAREDIAQIWQWTNKPVRYLFNTHWHYDHTMGNRAYADAFPGIDIIAQVETRNQSRGYNPGWLAKYPQRAERMRKMIETGKDAAGNALTEVQLADLKKSLPGFDPVWQEYKSLNDRLPNITFEKDYVVDLGNRVVELKHLGRGNTAGDAIAYLPKEKILVAGDLLDHPVPYLGGGYPVDLSETLKRMSWLDAVAIVPGHGDVMHDKVHLGNVIHLIDTVVAQVSADIYRVGNGPTHLAEVKEAVLKEIDLPAFRKQFGGDNKEDVDFFETFSLNGLITAAYAQLWGR